MPSLIAALACIAFVLGVIGTEKGEGGLSPLKAAVLAAFGAIAAYLLASMGMERLRRINNLLLFNIAALLIGVEIILRLSASMLPFAVVTLLPTNDRERLLAERGLYTQNSVAGDGMLYKWRPGATFPGMPWLKVDANGYRNPDVPGSVDVVILGDSVTIAQNSPRDMADMFRARGLSALNLGFGGYGPYHQRDAYRKYVLEAGIRHRIVLVNFCFCNDITDAKAYRRIESIGGTWRDYLGSAPTRTAFPFAFTPPWVISIALNAPYVAVQSYRNKTRESDDQRIVLPRGSIDARGWFPKIPPQSLNDNDWNPALKALDEIARLASGAKATLVIAYYPDLAQLYVNGLPDGNVLKAVAERDHEDAVARLRQLATKHGAGFVDYTKSLQAAGMGERVTATDRDYHPNERGVAIMADIMRPTLERILSAPLSEKPEK